MSIFNCNITYKKIEGDSYTSTYNKLLSQGFIDKYLNVKVDIAMWRKGRSEINDQASIKLGYKVNLFNEKKLLTGIRAIPDMQLFGVIDSINRKNIIEPVEEIILDEIGIDEFGDSNTNLLPPAVNINDQIYNSIDQPRNSIIPENKAAIVEQQISQYNRMNTGKELSLKPIGDGYLIKTEFKGNYLIRDNSIPLSEPIEDDFTPTDSNSNFDISCIKN